MPDIMKMGDEARYLGSWDCAEGELILTIADFKEEMIEGDKGRKEKKCILYFAEQGYKPMVLNLTNRKTLVRLYHTTDSTKLKGKLVKIGTDKVKAFGEVHDALRIRSIVPSAPTKTAKTGTAQPSQAAPVCSECGKPISGASGMDAAQVAAYTSKKYGQQLCAECAAAKAKAAAE